MDLGASGAEENLKDEFLAVDILSSCGGRWRRVEPAGGGGSQMLLKHQGNVCLPSGAGRFKLKSGCCFLHTSKANRRKKISKAGPGSVSRPTTNPTAPPWFHSPAVAKHDIGRHIEW